MKIFSKNQIRQIEENGFNEGIPSLRMMENAGAATAKCIRENFPESEYKYVAVVCGKGKNGGDGFVIARKLSETGYKTAVVLTHGKPVNDESAEMLARLRDLPVTVLDMDSDTEKCAKVISGVDLIVDAVFGIGFSGQADKNTALIFKLMNSAKAKRFSVDIPSGIDADSQFVDSVCVRADMTATPIGLKRAQVLYPAAEYCGEIKLINIGLPPVCYSNIREEMYTLEKDEIASLFRPRNPVSNKGDYGRVLIFAGSFEMPGAAVMAAKAAVNSGAGLVTLAFPDKAYGAISPNVTECVLLPLNSNESGRFSMSGFEKAREKIEKADVILIGCGIGQDFDTKEFVKSVLKEAKCPVIVDADGINILSSDIDILKEVTAQLVITPHPGEAARLLDTDTLLIQSSRLESVRRLCEKTNACVALKGSGTLVLGLNEDTAYLNTPGNAGMAVGGSGDVLSGIIASFIGQKIPLADAVRAAVYVHSLAGDEVSEKYSQMGTTPLKIIEQLPVTLKQFE
ncbi:MAG: NAD(P)H-hydrate dehydratase [Clostridiales bacterium]|nr:NAD(P)H-hydrate dehydratase [Clostridiales bacterium]